MKVIDKYDVRTAEAIVAFGDASDPRLLEWVQDLNWPVASVLAPFLSNSGIIVAPGIRQVLASNDESWKWSVLSSVVAGSPDLISLLRAELEGIARAPSLGERTEGLDELVAELLRTI